MSDNEHPATSLLGALALLILSPALALYRGWALWILWDWFAPLSWGPMPWLNAVGVCAIAAFLVAHMPAKDRGALDTLCMAIAYPLICLGVFGFVHLCGIHGV